MLRRLAFHPATLAVSRLIVGVIFLIAGLDKIQAPGAFADAVRGFHLIPGSLVLPFAYVVPWLEILVAAYLLTGFQARIGAIGAAVLLVMFCVALGIALATGDTNHACGCFGEASRGSALIALLSGGDTIGWWDLIRDLLLLALSLLVAVGGAGVLAVDGFLSRRRAAAAWVENKA